MKKLFFIFFAFCTCTAVAQNRAFKLRADKAYADKDYVTAAYYYDKALQNGTITTQGTVPYFSTRQNKKQHEAEVLYITYHLAESYRQYQNLIEAENWYKQTVDNDEAAYPLARLWYAVCLRSNNRINDAITQLQIFIDANKGNKQYSAIATREMNNTLFAKEQLAKPTLSKITKLPNSLNADAGDLAMVVNNGKYWFTSSRSTSATGERLNRIYTADQDSSSAKVKLELAPDPKTDIQYGTPSLEASGKRVYFTIWRKEAGNLVAAIYLSKYIDQHWLAPQRLNNIVNSGGFNSMQPCVTADGKKLFFTSNRPGGMGGTDIWESDLDIEGAPVSVVNLGSAINTAEDEQAPYYNEVDRKLVFASKGFVGMGNFDLFESVNTNGYNWTEPHNLGSPFNSTKDDLYYYPDSNNENVFYISSDRESECCLNLMKVRVYKPKPIPLPPPIQTAVLTGLVIDCATNKPLSGVSVNLVDSASKEAIEFTTDVTGKYKLRLTLKHAYTLHLEKSDYFTKVIPVPAVTKSLTDTLYNPVICQQEYEINKPVVIENILYDFNKYVLKPQSKVVLDGLITILKDNPAIKVELSSHTDSYGPDWANKLLSQHRAQSCVNYIISKGISTSRIIAKGYGASKPMVPNKYPDGRDNPTNRRLNRRTEFKVLSDE